MTDEQKAKLDTLIALHQQVYNSFRKAGHILDNSQVTAYVVALLTK